MHSVLSTMPCKVNSRVSLSLSLTRTTQPAMAAIAAIIPITAQNILVRDILIYDTPIRFFNIPTGKSNDKFDIFHTSHSKI
jgi:hypothetical protein